MKRVALIFVLLGAASGQVLFNAAFNPLANSITASGCKNGHTGTNTQEFCDWQFYGNPNVTGLILLVSAAIVDTGGTTGPPNFSAFSTIDNRYIPWTTGYAITSISTTSGTATAVMSGGPFEDGVTVWLTGAGAYNGAHTLKAGGSVWTGNTLTQVQWTQGGSPGSVTGGTMLDACGGAIPGGAAALRRVEVIAQHSTNGPNVGVPSYIFSQSWANTACTQHPWAATSIHSINDCLKVGTHFYHATSVCATASIGYCTSAGTIPTFNTAGGTTTDGTVVWQDDGTTNALPLEVVVDSSYSGITGTPTSGVFNVNSTTCGSGSTLCNLAQVASGDPVVWEWPYVYWINLFNAGVDGSSQPGVSGHYAAASWASQIDYIRFGVNVGGEIFPDAQPVLASNYGLTATEFQNIYATTGGAPTYTAIAATWQTLHPPWVPMASLNMYTGGCSVNCQMMPSLVAAAAMSHPGYTLGEQGLAAADPANWANGNSPVTSNGFAFAAMQYWPISKWLENQTDGDSVGPGAPAAGTTCVTKQTLTGPLPPILVFATQHHTNAFEIYATDISATYDPNYVAGTTFGSGCTPFPTGYTAALQNAAQGTPASTSMISGSAKISGKAVQQ